MKTVLHKDAADILAALNHLDLPAFVIDDQTVIVSCNERACAFFQHGCEDITGRRLDAFISPEKVEQHIASGCRHDGSSQGGSALSFLSPGIKKSGDTAELKISVVPCQDGAANQRLVVMQDVSGLRRLQRKASQRTKELSVFKAFAEVMARHEDIETIMRRTLGMLLSTMEAEQGWIYLFERDAGALHLRIREGAGEFPSAPLQLKSGECLFGRVFASGMPLLVEKASEDPRVTSIRTGRGGMESLVAIPIRIKGALLGVLGLASSRESYFTSMDIQLLVPIGNMLGVAIENIGLIEKLQEKMNQIELINELSGIVNSSLSIGTIFRIMVSEIRKLIDYDRASLLLYREKEDNLLIFALDTEMQTSMKKGVRAPIAGTSAGWVVRNNKPWITHDLKDDHDQFPLDGKLLDEGIRSMISIPLYHDKILGVFNFDSKNPGNYSGKDLAILLPVAKHISIALENALLFEEISRDKKEWEKTFDAITDMVWTEDGRQRVLRANKALLKRTGLTSVEVVGKSCGELLERVGTVSESCQCRETIAEKRPCFRELKGIGGHIFHFWAYPLIDDEGRLYSLVHYLKDVTAEKRLEQQLIRSDKLASLGTLVAGIAHEINNPLGIIAGYAEALLDRAKDDTLLGTQAFEDFPEYLETIHNEIFRCKGILRSLLDFARPTGGTFREIDLNELIKEVILLVNHRAKRLNHNIELRLNRDIPKISADPGNLRQVFMNIIINSMYFTPEGGSITITTERETEAEHFGGGGEGVRVTISDTGPGIGPDIVGKIFDPFFTTKSVGEGTGLGLAISHKIIEEHNGSIYVESEVGNGATFTMKLPAKGDRD